MNTPINFTQNAANKVHQLITEEGNPALMLRVFIQGGGCSGFQYGFTFEEEQAEDDLVITRALAAPAAAPVGVGQVAVQGGSGIDGDDDRGESGSGSAEVVKLLVDPMSFQYLAGAEIDYREDIHGSQFVIRNPNAKRTCGCGSSFATE